MRMDAQAYAALQEANIPNLGKKKSCGGYIVNRRERNERRRKEKARPDLNVHRNA